MHWTEIIIEQIFNEQLETPMQKRNLVLIPSVYIMQINSK